MKRVILFFKLLFAKTQYAVEGTNGKDDVIRVRYKIVDGKFYFFGHESFPILKRQKHA